VKGRVTGASPRQMAALILPGILPEEGYTWQTIS
jgi:hypothetical protein